MAGSPREEPVPRHQRADDDQPEGRAGRRAGSPVAGLRARLRDERALLRRLHRSRRPRQRRRVPRPRRAGGSGLGAPPPPRREEPDDPQRRPAALRPGRRPLREHRRRRGVPDASAEPRGRRPAREDPAPRRTTARRSSPTACATRGASPSTARPATSGSATSASSPGRRSASSRSGAAEPVNLGWDAYEGFEAVVWDDGGHNEPRGDGELVWPVATFGRTGGCAAVIGGYVYRGAEIPALRGRYVYGDFCTGTIWSLDPADPGARPARARARHDARLLRRGRGGRALPRLADRHRLPPGRLSVASAATGSVSAAGRDWRGAGPARPRHPAGRSGRRRDCR